MIPYSVALNPRSAPNLLVQGQCLQQVKKNSESAAALLGATKLGGLGTRANTRALGYGGLLDTIAREATSASAARSRSSRASAALRPL